MAVNLSIEVLDKDLKKTIDYAAKNAVNLKPVFKLIQESWYKGNKAIFSLKGPGRYADLTTNYKKFKTLHLGSPYPILRFTGALEETMTVPGKGINRISATTLELGTNIPYAKFLHFGTSKMKARPVVLLGPEQVAPSSLKTRTKVWVKMMKEYVDGVIAKGANL